MRMLFWGVCCSHETYCPFHMFEGIDVAGEWGVWVGGGALI